MYSSTCFGRPHAHHQEINNCSSSLWFYCWSVVVAVLLVVVGATGPTTTNSTAITTSNSKIRGCYWSCWAPDDGRKDARNMLDCTQTSSNKLEEFLHLIGCFIWIIWWCTDLQTLNRSVLSISVPTKTLLALPFYVNIYRVFHKQSSLLV
jgi:hypothetical protein